MNIRQNHLIDLYRRLTNFITSNYPDALVVENEKNVVITYPQELGRILIFQDSQEENLIVKILLELGQKITNKNSKTFYLSTIDELNCLKSGIQIIMEMNFTPMESTIKQAKTAINGQGYLLDSSKNNLGVVDLSLIPTNAFVYNTDIINNQEELSDEESVTPQKNILKFFKR